jgi:hypothetical protein
LRSWPGPRRKQNDAGSQNREKKVTEAISSNKRVMIIAGEASGDMHAAKLVREVKAKNTDILVGKV